MRRYSKVDLAVSLGVPCDCRRVWYLAVWLANLKSSIEHKTRWEQKLY